MSTTSTGIARNDIAAIERATLAAVPPEALEELPGWLLPMDPGPVGRAASAVPLSHAAPRPDVRPRVEARYAARGLPAVFRLPRVPAFEGLKKELAAGGYRSVSPTLVQVGVVEELLRAFGNARTVELAREATPAWRDAFLAQFTDAGAARARLDVLARSTQSRFALADDDGEPVAVGIGCIHGGWLGVHAMNTRAPHRGRGHAASILVALARAAQAGGVRRVVLQVEEDNARAIALYARAGLRTAWAYDYWQA